jgi:hypothetical protein
MHRALTLSVLVALAAAGSPASCQPGSNARRTPREVLQSSTNRDSLERAAIALARSGDAQDLALLGQSLRDRQFLARLDDLRNLPTVHLSRVIAALAERPTPQVVDLCLTLAEDSVFVAEGDRKSFVLELLAKVRPMNDRTAAVFQRSNAEGYFAFNARLLADNGSPRALGLFQSMIADKSQPVEIRIECLHVGIVPRRTQPAILRLADQILSRTRERAIAAAVIESVFDFRRDWFSIESGISKPPAWESTSTETRRAAMALADRALARRDLRPALRDTVSRARRTIARTLSA